MDLVDYRTDLRISAEKVKWFHVDKLKASGQFNDNFYKLVDVLLIGGAPWGFTLRGGREHREPLIITKVEEGSKAASVRLQVGDEIVNINTVPLSGSRQEAICLVKSSYKSLALVVRRKNRFKGRDEPAARPHSWHSAKLTEDHPEPTPDQSQDTRAPVWQAKHEARSSSKELSSVGEPTNQHQVSSQFNSVSSMERVERPSQPFPPGRLSPTKFSSSPEPHCGGSAPSKRDSSFSCFSASSSPPDPALPGSSIPSAEVVFYKGLQGDGARLGERPRYLQLPVGNGGWESPRSEEQPGSRFSGSGRSYTGPVWHVPERKKAAAPSPPPPPPPLRSDSFAATKVFPYSEGPGAHGQPKTQGRNMDRLSVSHHEKGPEARRSYNPPPKKDFLHPSAAAEDYNHNQLNPSKLFSLSSTDVRQSQPPYAYLSNHQRQYSDESTFYLQTRAAPQAKPQSVGSYYRSLQDLPTNRSQARSSTASLSSTAADQNPDGGGGHIRYYCITAKQPALQAEPPIWQGKAEGGGGGGGGGGWWGDAETTQWAGHNDRSSTGSQKAGKLKYPLPPSQLSYADSKERNGHFRPANGHPASGLSTNGKVSSEEKEGLRRAEGHSSENQGRRFSPGQPSEPKISPSREVRQDPWPAQDDQRICPKKTPLLHSLTQESRTLAERQPAERQPAERQPAERQPAERQPAASSGEAHADPSAGKLARRSDRYATTLRNEIQQKRAQLQKSRSAATLSCASEAEEEPEGWRSTETAAASSDGSYSTTYKDHLKEAQARVLQATSFRRRDLEPHGTDPAAGKPNGHVSRIGGRKRFALDKRMHSFSEPDQINKVGVEGESRTGNAGSFGDRRKFFEMTATKPAFSRPAPKPGQQQNPSSTSGGEHGEGKAKGRAPLGEPQDARRPGQAGDPSFRPHHYHNPDPGSDPGPGSLGCRQAMLDQQRLGTFAEYQATWSMQRKPSDTKTQGRYHSAENILDPDVEEKPVCQHERSRSSPSADFYGQNAPVPWREPAEPPYLEHRRDQQGSHTARETSESGVSETPAQLQQFPQSPESAPRDGLQSGDATAPLASHRTPQPDPGDHSHLLPPYPHSHIQSPGSEQPPQPPQNKGPMPQRPHLGLETTSSSKEFLLGAQADPVLWSSPTGTQLDPAPASGSSPGSTLAPSPRSSRSERGRRLEGEAEEEEGEGEEEQRVTADPALLSTVESTPYSSSKPAAAALTVPSANGIILPLRNSPSPQRLTDEPPLSMQDEAQSRPASRTESVMETTSAVKKAPVKIVLAECSSESERHQYLLHGDSPGVSEGVGPPQPSHLGSPEHPHPLPHPDSHSQSLFCAYTRQGPHGTEKTLPGVPKQGWVPLSADPPCSNGTSALGRGSEEDQKREELARDIMGKDKSLADILDQSKMRTTMDLMEGIFPQGEQLLEGTHQRRKAAPKHSSSRSPEERREEEGLSATAAVSLVPSSSYYNTSAPKAELLIKMKGMQEQMEEEQEEEDELDVNLAGKKQELIDSLSRKLQVLREARESVQEDVQDNNALGEEVEATVQRVCKPNELDKFRMFVGDLDKVVSLLLSLSGRLARVENALNSLEEDALPEEKRTLTEKRKLLIRQHEDAKELKDNLDRRERLVYGIMAGHLTPESLADYQHFVKMKSALIIEQRKLEDKIKLGEEQLKCLTDSLPLEQRLLF